MNTITVEVPDSLYRDFQDYAKRVGRSVDDLIREAIELYHEQKIKPHRDQENAAKA